MQKLNFKKLKSIKLVSLQNYPLYAVTPINIFERRWAIKGQYWKRLEISVLMY